MTASDIPSAEHSGSASNVREAIHGLVRLLARQAARQDYARALEAQRMKPYSKPEPSEAVEES